ncbi:hypothetical protein COV24_02515 [candidate division WWE3 bacterium CG10_big_fil_rev_8_21_14_0_10_32_10]|uniref:TraC-like domain-containing protein n=1 Tax=candidate division WWE3 bacterium CG10_big_fil_rev_8_21_14_0_10_32_10 TaxID=1975090 RepID=A0A2H0RAW7_UNCKA|nr:MAG: hypothetical protein COV24_02515 [candidate division WWE3 bacterium CG10_big_fil_rev_8_21_14_0_10_32_10]
MEQTTASTQDHLDIYEVKEDLVILKNGSASAVIETSAINFDLLSQREQDAAIFAYSGLLNSLNFPIQVLIKSRRMDVSEYIRKIEQAQKNTKNELLNMAVNNYKNYVENLVQNFEILDKTFYVAISYNENTIVPGESPFNWLKDLMGVSHKPQTKVNVQNVIEKAKPQIEPKIENLIKEFTRINIEARRLKTEELIKVFYESYNPDSILPNSMNENIKDYTSPVVEVLN